MEPLIVVLRSSDDDPAQRALALATDAALGWAQDRPVSVTDVRIEDGAILIDLTGPSAPEVLTLVVEVRRAWEQGGLAADQRPAVDVGFTAREHLERVGG